MNVLNQTNKYFYSVILLFIITLIDVLLTILLTITGLTNLSKDILYFSEFIILALCMYMLFKPIFTKQSNFELPAYITVYVVFIMLMSMRGLIYDDTYGVLRDTRKFLAPVPPIVIGFYFALFYKNNLPVYINKFIKFLTILSMIGLIEWIWWYASPGSLNLFYQKFFRVGTYYSQVKQISSSTDLGILTSSLRPTGFIIPTLTKRLTGLYLEPFSAGFNAALAVTLIWYKRMAEWTKTRNDTIFIFINVLAVMLTTSRSAYLFLAIALFFYMSAQKQHLTMLTWMILLIIAVLLFYGPVMQTIKSLNWAGHTNPVIQFIEHIFSFQNILGAGLGAMEKGSIYTDCGYGSIYGQLGIVGIIVIFIFYLNISRNISALPQDKFLVMCILVSTFFLFFFAAYPFGYKTFGFIHLSLGILMGSYRNTIINSQMSTAIRIHTPVEHNRIEIANIYSGNTL